MITAEKFLTRSFDGTTWTGIEPFVEELKARAVSSKSELERWVLDRSELDAACAEAKAELYIATSCDTENKQVEAAFAKYLEEVAPKLQQAEFDLDRKLVAMADKFPLDHQRYDVMLRSKRTQVAIFREENVPLHTELSKLSQQFGKIAGAQTVQFEGKERTLPQMKEFDLSTDRGLRERAWKATIARRLQDKQQLDELYDRMVALRDQVARNAGFKTDADSGAYVKYAFSEKSRFDYTPGDCRAFWHAVERRVVPFIRKRSEERRKALKLDVLRPWDLGVDVKGRDRLRPFDGGSDLVAKSMATMKSLDPRLSEMLGRMCGGTATAGCCKTEYLDLDSRRGKRPGGYQYMRDRTRRPFIFMNAAGLHDDAMTMLHEAGHAFHSMLCDKEPLVDYRHSPIEFAEVASMSMEHLSMPHWGAKGSFYANEDDLRRARHEHIEDSVTLLAWIATIDAFQHWVYANPTHTHEQRNAHWIELESRFGRGVSWGGLETERKWWWQRQSHLYSHPMYYIEYGIAQLGALQLWQSSKSRGEKAAVDAYIRALTLGGSRPLPELFKAADLSFDFGDATVARVVEAVERELAS
jgi:oligoendopeptidase F